MNFVGNIVISYLICPRCGNSFPIPRNKGRQRKKNHIKDIWCPFCGRVEKMKEIRYNDFGEDGDKNV